MKTRSRPFHRTVDPGVDFGEGLITEPMQVVDILAFYAMLKQGVDPELENAEEILDTIDAAIRIVRTAVPLGPDRPTVDDEILEIE